MMDVPFPFWIGLLLGLVLGIGAAVLIVRIRGWFGNPEARRLRNDIRTLRDRIAAKEQHIGEMLQQTEKIAEGLSHHSPGSENDGS